MFLTIKIFAKTLAKLQNYVFYLRLYKMKAKQTICKTKNEIEKNKISIIFEKQL
jgi:hypothetical protein